MSRLVMRTVSKSQEVVEDLYKVLERRIVASPPGICPVDISAAFLKLCHAQSCGKCTPCRIGLGQLGNLLEQVLDGEAEEETIALMEKTARAIEITADCAIGREAARMVLAGIKGFKDDFEEAYPPQPLSVPYQAAGAMCCHVSGRSGYPGLHSTDQRRKKC